METLKLSGIEMTQKRWEKLFVEKRRFIFKYRKVYELKHSRNVEGGFYLLEVQYLRLNKGEIPYTKRGYLHAFTAKGANELLGREIFLTP